jgi:hypothetical protein
MILERGFGYAANIGGSITNNMGGIIEGTGAGSRGIGFGATNGLVNILNSGAITLHVGDQLTFLNANGGVSGSFEATQGSFVDAACNPNAGAVAKALRTSLLPEDRADTTRTSQ